MLAAPPNPLALPSDAFAHACKQSLGVPVAHALDAFRRLHRTGVSGHTRITAELPPLVRTHSDDCDEGTVTKFLLRVPPAEKQAPALRGRDLEIESVLIPMVGRRGVRTYTLCVSSQVGCAMGCTFCETAQMGLIRHLTPDEIVAQWFTARHILNHDVSNIVFMGMGEPLDNITNVLDAIAVLKDHNGPAVTLSKITISTVGRVDGLRALSERMHEPGWHRIGVAISLNAPTDEIRDAIMPINRRFNLAELQRAIIDIPAYGGGKLCIEYVLIPGVNDAPEHARAIADFLRPINEAYMSTGRTTPRTLLNLIPYNPRRNSPWPAPLETNVDAFLNLLRDLGIYAKRRRTKGRSMMGACGQLGNEQIRQRKLVGLTIASSDSHAADTPQ
jgi:23S rRNA (adenine2503-C2)-methyltransferase